MVALLPANIRKINAVLICRIECPSTPQILPKVRDADLFVSVSGYEGVCICNPDRQL